ncbi:MAG: tetratricopeptide repeat protein [Candidatus Eisenbacteria bacterium]|nr:tetratricopeptide repeat protein [Candidatus Eisenbacteria bacterium]
MLPITPVALALSTLVATAAPDTGLFAPVVAQQAHRLEALSRPAEAAPDVERVETLLAAGRVDEARAALATLAGEPRRVAVAKARVLLAAQDFAAAAPLVAAMAAQRAPTDDERQVRFDWLFAHDDAATVDRLTRGASLAARTRASLPVLLAAGRLAYDLLNYARADSCFARVLERAGAPPAARAAALTGLAKSALRRRDFDRAFAELRESVAAEATADGLTTLSEALVRLGRTDEAITAAEWAVRLNPYSDAAHYLLGNGYSRRNYTELFAAYPQTFADSAGRRALAQADSLVAAGDRSGARATCEALRGAHPGWADACVRLASLDFEDCRFESARDLAFAALALCPEYGRAHAVLAKALESQRFAVDVHRAGYERRFAAAPMPKVPGIERFVLNWKSLSPRHQKRVALSVAPWRTFLPVLIEGGATYTIKPLHMLLSETPYGETLRDQRISYDSRLWDDVRGAGGYHTVTGIEDVERTIFDRYNTVLHELTHQVHGVLTADQAREIQERYRRAKARDDATKNGFLSRYAGGSVHEYFAEGANALESPRRDRYDPREVVRERLAALDPDLMKLVQRRFAQADVSASYAVAYVNAGDDRVERGAIEPAVAFYEKALARSPGEETALVSLTNALTLGGRRDSALAAAARALAAHPASGAVVTAAADAYWHGGRGLDQALALLERSRPAVRAEDRWRVDLAIGRYAWMKPAAARSLAAFDSVLAYQSDNPEALRGRAAALALTGRWDSSAVAYDRAVRVRTGIVELRCDYARDLLRAGRVEQARTQLAEAQLLDRENATAEALRGWADLLAEDRKAARAHVTQALGWGPWCDLASIVLGGIELAEGNEDAANAAWAPVRERIASGAPPGYVYRPKLAVWEGVHELPAVERMILEMLEGR